MIVAGWVPIFLREMLLFRRKLLRVGYLFSAMVTPIIYLIAFGLGLGNSVKMAGSDYLSYLIPGLVGMSSMNNSYTWVASGVNLNRLYFKTFQIFVQAPIRPSSILTGEVLAGMVKGLFASMLIIIVGLLTSSTFSLTGIFLTTLILNCFFVREFRRDNGNADQVSRGYGDLFQFFHHAHGLFLRNVFPRGSATELH